MSFQLHKKRGRCATLFLMVLLGIYLATAAGSAKTNPPFGTISTFATVGVFHFRAIPKLIAMLIGTP